MSPGLSRIDPLVLLFVIVIVAAAAVAFWPLLDVVIVGLSLAVVLLPVHRALSRRLPGAVAAGLVVAAVVLILLLGSGFMAAVLAQNAQYLDHILQTIFDWVWAPAAEQAIPLPIPPEQIAGWVGEHADTLQAGIAGFAEAAPLFIVKICVFFLTLYIGLLKGDTVRDRLVGHLPTALKRDIGRLSTVTVDTLYAIYVVHVATAVITFFLALPFFYFLGYGHILFYSVMAAVFQLVPIIGPSLVMLFLGAFALSQGDARGALLVALVGYPIVCALPDIYFRPLMMGRRASIHPVIMWIGFFGGLAAMGIVGFILGPLFMALLVAGYGIAVRELTRARTLPGERDPVSNLTKL
ncbi:AI-2E family transporter [Methanoculleus sp. FWC-SCC1]|uniref:AI-2E family transporter n=1 Tax=Methanoculleus frigidifontis TaxID=2584085 RepID=A0ABT8M634_9EURY|nr:AI-2E family transporter [Methanoculleus sp. FWC-SCC1]MDN7023344.1 AI-2E family transporter [Methanoculleus sp. FWC-SCC1]